MALHRLVKSNVCDLEPSGAVYTNLHSYDGSHCGFAACAAATEAHMTTASAEARATTRREVMAPTHGAAVTQRVSKRERTGLVASWGCSLDVRNVDWGVGEISTDHHLGQKAARCIGSEWRRAWGMERRRGQRLAAALVSAAVLAPIPCAIVANLVALRHDVVVSTATAVVLDVLTSAAMWMPWVLGLPEVWSGTTRHARCHIQSRAVCAGTAFVVATLCPLFVWMSSQGPIDVSRLSLADTRAQSTSWRIAVATMTCVRMCVQLLAPAAASFWLARTPHAQGTPQKHSFCAFMCHFRRSRLRCCCNYCTHEVVTPRHWMSLAVVVGSVATVAAKLLHLWGHTAEPAFALGFPSVVVCLVLDARTTREPIHSSPVYMVAIALTWTGVYLTRELWFATGAMAEYAGEWGKFVRVYGFIVYTTACGLVQERLSLAAAPSRRVGLAILAVFHLALEYLLALLVSDLSFPSLSFFVFVALDACFTFAVNTRVHRDVWHSLCVRRLEWYRDTDAPCPPRRDGAYLTMSHWRLHYSAVRTMVTLCASCGVMVTLATEMLASPWIETLAGFPGVAAEILASTNATQDTLVAVELLPGCSPLHGLSPAAYDTPGVLGTGWCAWQSGIFLSAVPKAKHPRVLLAYCVLAVVQTGVGLLSLGWLSKRLAVLRQHHFTQSRQGALGRPAITTDAPRRRLAMVPARVEIGRAAGSAELVPTTVNPMLQRPGCAEKFATSGIPSRCVQSQAATSSVRVSVLDVGWTSRQSLWNFWGLYGAHLLVVWAWLVPVLTLQAAYIRLAGFQLAVSRAVGQHQGVPGL